MAASTFLGQIATQTITATGVSATFQMNQAFNTLLAEIELGSAPTGTTPTITFQLQISLDGVNYVNFGSPTSSLNAAGVTALSNSNVGAPLFKLAWTVTGTTPSFTNVTVNFYVS